MATRTTLKGYFETGDVPTQSEFAQLIDGVPNLTDSSVTDAEFAQLDGVTSPIQTQIDGKLSTTGGAMTGAITGNVAITGFRPYLTETTSRALALADAGKFIIANNASGVTLTIPSSVFTLGTEIDFIQKTAGTLTLTAVAGVTLNGTVAGSAAVTAIWGGVTIKLIATNEWVAVGKI